MDEFKAIWLPIILILAAIVMFVGLVVSTPTNEAKFYKEQGIVCNGVKDWGFKRPATTCYKVSEIK